MGFLQDIGSALGEFNSIRDEMKVTVTDTVSSLTDSGLEIKDTLETAKVEIIDTTAEIKHTVERSTNLSDK